PVPFSQQRPPRLQHLLRHLQRQREVTPQRRLVSPCIDLLHPPQLPRHPARRHRRSRTATVARHHQGQHHRQAPPDARHREPSFANTPPTLRVLVENTANLVAPLGHPFREFPLRLDYPGLEPCPTRIRPPDDVHVALGLAHLKHLDVRQ